MVKADEQALICDLAETYHIFDYRSLPTKLVATLSAGLRENSRIRLVMNKEPATQEVILLAGISDRLSILLARLTGSKQTPELITDRLYSTEEEEEQADTFGSGEEFMARWKQLNGG